MSARDARPRVGYPLGAATAGDASAHLWYAWVGDHARDVDAYSRAFLSADEQAHLAGYRIREAAERYVVTRSLVRVVLAERLQMPPRDIRVSRTDTGKPIVTEGIHFNVSHSSDLILLALSDQQPVGVDVERRRPVQKVDALRTRWLSPAEQGEFEALRRLGLESSDAFLRIWSLKEARIKALGVGISGAGKVPLHAVLARPLDDLLDPLSRDRQDAGYVGAIAFA